VRNREKMFIPYVMFGCPDIPKSLGLIRNMVEWGADYVEIGLPFSDPMADGKTIQQAGSLALLNNAGLDALFEALRGRKIPGRLILMTYYNIIFGRKDLFARLSESGIGSLIVPDLPLEEALAFSKSAAEYGISLILLASPTTSDARYKKIAALSSPFVYYVSIKGITGSSLGDTGALKKRLERLRKLSAKPVCAGFGISTLAQVKELKGSADGIIIGSEIIRLQPDPPKLKKFTLDCIKIIKG